MAGQLQSLGTEGRGEDVWLNQTLSSSRKLLSRRTSHALDAGMCQHRVGRGGDHLLNNWGAPPTAATAVSWAQSRNTGLPRKRAERADREIIFYLPPPAAKVWQATRETHHQRAMRHLLFTPGDEALLSNRQGIYMTTESPQKPQEGAEELRWASWFQRQGDPCEATSVHISRGNLHLLKELGACRIY